MKFSRAELIWLAVGPLAGAACAGIICFYKLDTAQPLSPLSQSDALAVTALLSLWGVGCCWGGSIVGYMRGYGSARDLYLPQATKAVEDGVIWARRAARAEQSAQNLYNAIVRTQEVLGVDLTAPVPPPEKLP